MKLDRHEIERRLDDDAAYRASAGKNGKRLNLVDCTVEDFDFSGKVLSEIVAQDAVFVRCRFEKCDLYGADLSGATAEGCDFKEATLAKSDLMRAKLAGASFEFANLTGAEIIEADLRDARFSFADLSGAIVKGCDVAGADFSHARLVNAAVIENRGEASFANAVTEVEITEGPPPALWRLVEEGGTRTLDFEKPGRFTVGRDAANDLHLPVLTVGRRQAAFEVTPLSVTVADLDSPSGTRVNGQSTRGPVALAVGDVVDLSGIRFRLEEASPLVAEDDLLRGFWAADGTTLRASLTGATAQAWAFRFRDHDAMFLASLAEKLHALTDGIVPGPGDTTPYSEATATPVFAALKDEGGDADVDRLIESLIAAIKTPKDLLGASMFVDHIVHRHALIAAVHRANQPARDD
ncbi:MAG: pentapeptide repeat-containing protein [Deltaproteobacteria bacterium]|nr:pentapeptide repeat-containing protein [Deltaproteobacteria bacterium]